MDRNQHVKEYLEYYINLPTPPRFAIILNGPWGIGKTFLVKDFMKHRAPKGLRYIYVSLYGLASFDEIDDALVRAVYPLLDNKGIQLAGRAVKVVAKYFRLDVDLQASDVLDKANSDLFIFDDLERCDLPINKILGYINTFVEHEDRKVIIIANEAEIKGCENYSRIREKLIGKTLVMESAFEQALEVFFASIKDECAKTFLAAKRSVISDIYDQSGVHNLRALQQIMWEFERFYMALDEKYRNSDAAMTALLRLLFALSFELKAGRLKADHLFRRNLSIVTSRLYPALDKGEPSPIAAAQKRYPEVDLSSTALSDETLVNLLSKGIIASAKIRSELDASSFFVEVADEPAWRTVWHHYERTEKELDAALIEMERAFGARNFTVSGEIAHVLGLRLWLARIGGIPKTLECVIDEGKAYIDDLYAAGRLEAPSPKDSFMDLSSSGYGGLHIYESSTQEYRDLLSYLADKRQAAVIDTYPEVANSLLSDVTADPDRFRRRVILSTDASSECHNMPVLVALDPNNFVSAFQKHHPAQQRTLLLALKARYEQGMLERELKDERPWAIEVRRILHEWAEGLSPMSKYRIRQILDHTLDEVLGLGMHSPPTVESATDSKRSLDGA